MIKRLDLITHSWDDYELLDSGDNSKLERYGDIILARPETQALWHKERARAWAGAGAFFSWEGKKGIWKIAKDVPDTWCIAWHDMRLSVRLTAFKHTGIFPEQAPNWEWITERVKGLHEPKVLNLFGYTGAASIAAALAGAHVTHVDASKQSLTWSRENAQNSGVAQDKIRYLLDDAMRFAKREVRRGEHYDGIILDPPAFGRGAKGEVWHIEKDLPVLIETLHELLVDTSGAFFVLSGYAAGYAPQSFAQLTQNVFTDVNTSYGELSIKESGTNRVIPAGIYTRFARGLDAS